jgi:hypothetical protein
MSGREVVFQTGEALQPSQQIRMSILWPMRLEDRIPLQLILTVTIMNAFETTAIATILRYEFRTRAASRSTNLDAYRSQQAAACIAPC